MSQSNAFPRTLLPLFTDPNEDPAAWRDAVTSGAGTVAMLRLPATDQPTGWSALHKGIRELAAAGVQPLGHLSLGYAARPMSAVRAELTSWASLAVPGVFLDHAPTSHSQLELVVRTIAAADHSGLERIVLNPGRLVNPVYRWLNATICTFEGSWSEYLTWSGEGAEEGDGHLVFGVPRPELPLAHALVLARGAGLHLITEQANAHSSPGPRDAAMPAARRG